MKTIKWLEDIDFSKGLKIKALIDTDFAKEVRITMPKQETMKEHKAPGAIKVQVLLGKIWFEVDGQKQNLQKGDMICLDAQIPHSLGGLENSIIRLSLSKIDNIARVKNLVRLKD